MAISKAVNLAQASSCQLKFVHDVALAATGNTKGASIIVPLTSCLTGLD
jgi:hypothetical protein